MLSIFFKQPDQLPYGFEFERSEIFTGEYGRILELLCGGLIVSLAIIILIIILVHLWRNK